MDKFLAPRIIPDNPLLAKKLDLENEEHLNKIRDVHSFVLFYTETCLTRCENNNTVQLSRSEERCIKGCIHENFNAFSKLVNK